LRLLCPYFHHPYLFIPYKKQICCYLNQSKVDFAFTFRFHSKQEINQTELSYKDVHQQDPLSLATYLAIGIILLNSLYIIIYSHKNAWNFLPKLNPTSEGNQLEMNSGNKYRNYQETKNTIIGAGATLVAVTMISLFLVPSFMARKYLEEDQNGINFGWGRAWTYIGRMTMAVLSFLILPFVIIVNNRKMRKVLLRQLKDMFV
jgi:hypothetical protein